MAVAISPHGKDKASAVRSRFDAAHELAHLLLHRKVDGRRVKNTADWKILETQAHRFAAAFLLPAKSFSDELWAATLDGMLARKGRRKVSIAMMIVRCEHIGIKRSGLSKSAKNFKVPCVYQFRHVRFGRQIRYLACFSAKWNELGRQGSAPLP
jgi:Zn-dependent peptidase ImmA (M78 family)